MKKTILFFLLITLPIICFSQSEKDLLEAGVQLKLVSKITNKYNGSVTEFYESWSRKGKIHKPLVTSLKKLGFKDDYLIPYFKRSQNIRFFKVIGYVTLGIVIINEDMINLSQIECGCSPGPNFY